VGGNVTVARSPVGAGGELRLRNRSLELQSYTCCTDVYTVIIIGIINIILFSYYYTVQ
jgi:hypothetical protein